MRHPCASLRHRCPASWERCCLWHAPRHPATQARSREPTTSRRTTCPGTTCPATWTRSPACPTPIRHTSKSASRALCRPSISRPSIASTRIVRSGRSGRGHRNGNTSASSVLSFGRGRGHDPGGLPQQRQATLQRPSARRFLWQGVRGRAYVDGTQGADRPTTAWPRRDTRVHLVRTRACGPGPDGWELHHLDVPLACR